MFSIVLVLVNGSATKDFSTRKDLRQEDLLSPFLFVLVMEVLTCLTKRTVLLQLFKGFTVNEDIAFMHH